jgi:hypothetical protein
MYGLEKRRRLVDVVRSNGAPDAFVDLLVAMLERSPANRPTAVELLEHPALRGEGPTPPLQRTVNVGAAAMAVSLEGARDVGIMSIDGMGVIRSFNVGAQRILGFFVCVLLTERQQATARRRL